MKATIEFSKDEIDAALALFDVAVKAAGLQAAQNAAVLAAKFIAATQMLQPPSISGHDAHDGALLS